MKSIKTGGDGNAADSETVEAVAAVPVIEGAPLISAEKPDFSKVEIEPLFMDFVDFETFSKSDFRAVKEEGEEKLSLLMVEPHIPAGAKLY